MEMDRNAPQNITPEFDLELQDFIRPNTGFVMNNIEHLWEIKCLSFIVHEKLINLW